MAGKEPVLPPRAAPATARHVATAIAAVQRKVGSPPAGPNAGGRAPAPHVAAATAAVQRQPAAPSGIPSGMSAASRPLAPHVAAVLAPVQLKPAAGARPVPVQARKPVPPALSVPRPAARPVAPPPPVTSPGREAKRAPAAPAPRPPDPRWPAATLQAKFPLRKYYGKTLSNQTLRELEAIQDLLKDRTRVKRALEYLESQVEEYVEGGETPNSALNLALQDEELRWMNPGRIKVGGKSSITRQDPKRGGGKSTGFERFPDSGNGALPPVDFVSRALVPLRALKDVGAVVNHGEYAHRLQWYIISFWFRVNFTADELRHLYLIMGSSNRVIQHPIDKDASISLWDAVLDVRGAWAMDKGEMGELYGGVDEVGFAVPGFLTGVLTIDYMEPKAPQVYMGPKAKVLKPYDDNYLKGERWHEDLPYLSYAVTSRKLKRLAV